MNKREIEDYTEVELKEGKMHQEIFDKIALESDFNLHKLAEVVRKVPSLKNRKKYAPTNFVLIGIISLSLISRFFYAINFENELNFFLNLFFTFVTCLLLFGLYNFKRNAHLITGFFILSGAAIPIIGMIGNFNVFALADIFTIFFATTLSFYLSEKLPADYVLNKELKKTEPEQRQNMIQFIED